MFPGALMVLVLGAAPVETVSAVGPPGIEPGARERPRLHGEVSFATGAALASPALGVGAGFHLELGTVLADRVILSARASIATIVIVGFFQLGVSGAYALNDMFQLGLGAAWTINAGFVPDQAGAGSVQFPIRLAFLTRPRSPSEVARTGLQIGLEVAPGVAYLIGGGYGSPGQIPTPAFSISGLLTLGYAVW